MPNFMDLAREIRDMIYAKALISNGFLVAEREQLANSSSVLKPHYSPLTPVSTALLQVNKAVNTEATEVFYAVNTFKLSSYAILGRPSILRFTLHVSGGSFSNPSIAVMKSTKFWSRVTSLQARQVVCPSGSGSTEFGHFPR